MVVKYPTHDVFRQMEQAARRFHGLKPNEYNHEKEEKIKASVSEFYRVFHSYLSWAYMPNGETRVAFDHYTTDADYFGLCITGAYTCLVMMRNDGSVSGHS